VLRCASKGVWGLFFGSEAGVRVLRGASLEEFAGNGWFFGSEADVMGPRRASLLSRMVVLAEMF